MFAFFILLMLCGGVGVLCWLMLQRVTSHLKKHPEAAEVVAKHIIAVILSGGEDKKEVPIVPRSDGNGVVHVERNAD